MAYFTGSDLHGNRRRGLIQSFDVIASNLPGEMRDDGYSSVNEEKLLVERKLNYKGE